MDTGHVVWLGLSLKGPTEGVWTLAPRRKGVELPCILMGSIAHTK